MIGRTLGAYEIVAVLGRGGAAYVYRARHSVTGQTVALKVIPNDAEDPQLFVRRFEIETQVVRALDHPNIVAVYDAGETADLVYLVMQCVDGGNLRQRMKEGHIEQAQAIAYAVQAARALHHAHQKGVVHRDVKPSNMLLDADDPTHLLLADFGIAKIQGMRGITKSGTIVGTPEYMSPEQAENRESDPRSDIYSLGCVVYELLTGRPPFTAPYPLSVLHQQLHATPAYIRGYNPAVPKQLCRVVEIALSKNPDARFPTAEHFARALAPFAEPGYKGASSEPLAQVTLPPVEHTMPPLAATLSSELDLPTRPLPSERVPAGRRLEDETTPEERGPRGPWPLVLGDQSPPEIATEETVRLGTVTMVASAAETPAEMSKEEPRLTDGRPEQGHSSVEATGKSRPPSTGDPLKGHPPTHRPASISAPVSHSLSEAVAATATAATATAATAATATANPSRERPRPRVTSRPAVIPPLSSSTAGSAMPSRATAGPILAPRESQVWPKTIVETSAPRRSARQRRGGMGVTLSIVAVLALILTASLVASATGLIELPGKPSQARTATATPVPTATATEAPTATEEAATPTTNLQQIADQRAYNSFRAATLGRGSDSSCSAAGVSTTFVAAQPIYINLCTSSTVSASTVSVVVRQIGKSVCTLGPIQASASYFCHSDYSLNPGHYDIVVSMKVDGTQATARDLPFTVTR